MPEPLFLGIDGGGSKLRLVIVNTNLDELASLTAGPANPNIIGHEAARRKVRRGIVDVLDIAGLREENISAVGIGIAGASNLHSESWLVETVKPVLPESCLTTSSDLEIALAGALAQGHGILLLAGTGSAAYGVSPAGERLQIGGWGYLLGDEGSSFWIGSQLLKHVLRARDAGNAPRQSGLAQACLDELGLSEVTDLIAWVYRSEEAPATRVAGLAPLVLDRAEHGDGLAVEILTRAAAHLAEQVETMRRRLKYEGAPIAFAGGLLDKANWLSTELTRRLGLPERPTAMHPPVIGAAILAKWKWSAANRI